MPFHDVNSDESNGLEVTLAIALTAVVAIALGLIPALCEVSKAGSRCTSFLFKHLSS